MDGGPAASKPFPLPPRYRERNLRSTMARPPPLVFTRVDARSYGSTVWTPGLWGSPAWVREHGGLLQGCPVQHPARVGKGFDLASATLCFLRITKSLGIPTVEATEGREGGAQAACGGTCQNRCRWKCSGKPGGLRGQSGPCPPVLSGLSLPGHPSGSQRSVRLWRERGESRGVGSFPCSEPGWGRRQGSRWGTEQDRKEVTTTHGGRPAPMAASLSRSRITCPSPSRAPMKAIGW